MLDTIVGIASLALAISCFVIAITLMASDRPSLKEFLYFSFQVLFTASVFVIAFSALIFGLNTLLGGPW